MYQTSTTAGSITLPKEPSFEDCMKDEVRFLKSILSTPDLSDRVKNLTNDIILAALIEMYVDCGCDHEDDEEDEDDDSTDAAPLAGSYDVRYANTGTISTTNTPIPISSQSPVTPLPEPTQAYTIEVGDLGELLSMILGARVKK